MLVYIVQRVLTALVTLFGMSVLIFVLLRLVPGDIVDIIFSSAGFVNPAAKVELARELGLDRPIALQYVRWLEELAEGNLGKSYRYDVPAWQVVKPRLPVTLELAILAILIAVVLGVFTGVLSAARQDSALDYALSLLSLAGLSMPSFWLGMMIILFLVSWAGWIPSMVYVSPREDLRAHLLQFVFPALAVGYRGSALIMRITRSSMLEVLGEDYIRTARAKGQREWPVIFGHALRNAILPIITVIGFEFAFMIGGLVVTETVFNLPGVARYLVDAILWRDYPVAQNLVMLIGVAVVVVNLSVDLLYGWLDPRIRYGAT
ncbi:MAG TPA: ABC transporter permease [Verrucomicrobiae bacterium]|nr:ABC transporter permease [Verrucomicrobiae bacterium]